MTGDGHTVVVAGGLIAGDGSTASAFELDTATGKQTTLPDLAVPVHDAAGVTLGGHPLVVGGGNATEQSVVQRLAGGRWRVVGHLPGARSDLVTVATGTGLLVIGGYDGVTSPPALLASPDGTHFTVAAQLPQPVRYPAVTTCDGSVWVLGGESNGAMITPIQRIAGAGTAHVTAQVVAHLRTGLGHAMAVCVGGRVLLMGGRTGQDTVTTRMWWFDPSSSSLSPAGQLPHGLADAGVLGTPSAAYLIGGETPGLSDRVMRVTWR